MKRILFIILTTGFISLCGCSTEKAPAPPQRIAAFTLAPADKEKLMTFRKDLLSMESITDKAVKLAGEELKNVIKGGGVSLNLPSVIDKAKAECMLTGETLAKKGVPEALSPEVKNILNDGKTGLVSSYKAYADSFEAIKSFVSDKNPMSLLEYRKKNAEAQALYNVSAEKIKSIMTAAGITQ